MSNAQALTVNLSIGNDVAAGLKQGMLIGAAVLALTFPQSAPQPLPATAASAAGGDAALQDVDFAGVAASADAQAVARWVVAARDNGRQPFVIIDKKQAQVFVFHAGGHLLGATPVLLGHAAGDDTVPGIGQRPMSDVMPEERTTPAGRFVAEPGRNTSGEDIVWVDYEAAVSMHRVRATDPRERRLERLASATASDNRISYGCINMPVAFFERVVWPLFRAQRGIVYVLPEVKTLGEVFPAVTAAAAGAAVGALPGAASPSSVTPPARPAAPTIVRASTV